MQHAVSYQPSAPARTATAGSRLSSLFSKSLRKSSSHRDLISDARRSGAGATLTSTPLTGSLSGGAYAHHAGSLHAYGSAGNVAGLASGAGATLDEGARTAGSGGGGGGASMAGMSQRTSSRDRTTQDSGFIPYHGPIAPPPPEHTQWAQQQQRRTASTKAGQFAEDTRSKGDVTLPPPNVGPAFSRGQFERSFMFPKHSEATTPSRTRGPYGSAARRRGSAGGGESGDEQRSGALVGLGLSGQADRAAQQQQQQQQAWRSASSGLPNSSSSGTVRASSNAFAAHEQEANERLTRFFEAGHANAASPTPTSPDGAASPSSRLNVGYGLPTAYVHGGNTPKLPDSPSLHSSGALPALPSLMRADYREATREPVVRGGNNDAHAAAFAYRGGIVRGSHNASSTSVVEATTAAASAATPATPQRYRTGTANSISSNEGGSAGDMTMSAGNRSASTSMTSLRAPSAAAAQAQQQQHVKFPSSTASASATATAPRGSTSQEMLGSASSVRSTPARRALSSSSTPDLRRLDTEGAVAAAPPVVPSQARVPVPRWEEERELLGAPVGLKRTPPTNTMWQQGAPLLSPIAASTQGGSSSPGAASDSRGVESTPEQRGIGSGSGNATTAETEAQREAWRRFNLLQQLHLDEVAQHAPEATGFLDADNGCERILMPRPRLRSRASVDSTVDSHSHSHSHAHAQQQASFERNRPASYARRVKAESNPDLRARARAHERMARVIAAQPLPPRSYDLAHEQGQQQPFFHHRMPPAPPSATAAAAPAEESVPLGCVPTRQRTSVQPLRTSPASLLVTPPTPGLSPSGFSDAFSSDDFTPDLETVLAQGAALEADRAQWRRQHARSFGSSAGEGMLRGSRARSRDRRSSTGSSGKGARRKTAGQWNISEPVPLPDSNAAAGVLPSHPPPAHLQYLQQQQQQQQERTLRHARSSPQLGQVNRRDFASGGGGGGEARPETPPSPNVPTSFLPFFGGASAHRRALSKDSALEQRDGKWRGIFKKKRSRASTSAATGRLSPTREREQLHAASLATQRRMRSSQSWDNAMTSGSRSSPLHLQANTRRTSWRQSTLGSGRFTPVPVDEVRGAEASGARRAALVHDEPVVIGRNFDASRAAAERRESGFRFPPPSTASSGGEVPGQYGFAISAPRPELGEGEDKVHAPLAQGRHAMSAGYHRPSNSADLKALLATSLAAAATGEGSRGSVSSTRTRDSKRGSITTPKRSSSIGRKAKAELKEAMAIANAPATPPSGATTADSSRRNSLGMSSAGRHASHVPKPDFDEPVQTVGQSLPVPPRRPRLSGTSSPIHQGPLPPPPSLSFNKASPVPFTTPFSDANGFAANATAAASPLPSALAHSPGAFFTPPLGGTPLTTPGVTSYFVPNSAPATTAAVAPSTPEATPRAPQQQQDTPVIPAHLDVDSPPGAAPGGPSPVPSSALGSDDSPPGGSRTGAGGENIRAAWRRRVGHSSSSDSSMSQRSTAVRELWTTDDHQEESFSGLFLRRPSAAGSGSGASEGSTPSRERVRAVSLASSGEMDPAPPGEMPASPALRETGTPKSQTKRGEAVLRDAKSAAASYRAAMQASPHAQAERAEMSEEAEESLALAPAFDASQGSPKSTAASRLGRMGAEFAQQQQASPNPSEPISSLGSHTLVHSVAPSSSTPKKLPDTPGLVAASFIDFDQGASHEEREDLSAASSMLGVPRWSKADSASGGSGEGAFDSSGEARRRSTESSASIGFANLVKPRVWPEPPKSPGGRL